LAGVTCGLALVAGAGAQGACNQLAASVVVRSLHVLQHQATGELAFLFFHAHYALHRGNTVARTDVAEKRPVGARVEAMNAGQAPASVAQPAEVKWEHRMRNKAPTPSTSGVADITVRRVQVTVPVAPVAQRICR